MRIGVTGSTGLIGTALSARLTTNGHSVCPIVRREPLAASEIGWDPGNGVIDAESISQLDAVVHLAGAGIGDHRWTERYKQVLLASRVDGTTLLAQTLAELGGDGPQVLISGSAIGYYGDRGDELVDESSPAGTGFLADICRAWEAGTAAAESAGVRVVQIRTGIVLSRDGGALSKMLPLFKLALGGRFGNGRQWMSWITIGDQIAAIEHLLTSSITGPVNLTAPAPVRNADFAKALGRVLHRPAVLPVPGFGPKLLLGSELAKALLLDGQRVRSSRLASDGFRFADPEIEPALRSALGR